MRLTLTIEADSARINKILEIASALDNPDTGPEQVAIEPESVAPPPMREEPPILDESVIFVEPESGNGAAPPKRRGRPPKMVVEKAVQLSEPAAPVAANERTADKAMIQTVADFLAEHKHLGNAVLTLLGDYHAEKVSSVPPSKREEFLSRMDGLVEQQVLR